MPINVIKVGPIKNCANSNRAIKKDAQKLIDQLTYDDLWREEGTLHDCKSTRIDQQGDFPVATGSKTRFYNVQVQINGMKGKSTIAHVNISDSLCSNDGQKQKEVLKKFQETLSASLNDDNSYNMTGSP
jgi:hypothetical protein